MSISKSDMRIRRKKRIRKKVTGTSACPRLTVYRSLRHTSVQAVDDVGNRTVAYATTDGKANGDLYKGLSKKEAAQKVGAKVAELCKQAGVERVVFDRNGYRYHGRVLAVASGAREGGLVF